MFALLSDVLLLLQDQGFEDAKPVIEALKSKGVTKIGAAGFCWGGHSSCSGYNLQALFIFVKVIC